MDVEIKDKVIKYRRDFHKYAEGTWAEFRTSSKIADVLEKLGFNVLVGVETASEGVAFNRPSEEVLNRHIERALEQGANMKWIKRMGKYTGTVGIWRTGKPGPTSAFRFDIDALPMKESDSFNHKPFRDGFISINSEYMHSCGHDAHGSIGLGLAHMIAENSDKLCGTIKLIFQPAEEGGGGARGIVKKGLLDDVKYYTSIHMNLSYNGITLKSGQIAGGSNDFLDSRRYNVIYTGKSAHSCGDPHNGRNALLAACTATLNIHAIAPHSEGMLRVNVGILKAGTSRNIIAPNAYFELETRGESKAIADYGEHRVNLAIEHAAEMYEVGYKMEKVGHTPTAKSDIEMVNMIRKSAEEIEWFTDIYDEANVGGSDDTTEMMLKTQENGGVATYLGIGANHTGGLHNNMYDFDENCLEPSVQLCFSTLKKINKN